MKAQYQTLTIPDLQEKLDIHGIASKYHNHNLTNQAFADY
jgi:hypothetical protein